VSLVPAPSLGFFFFFFFSLFFFFFLFLFWVDTKSLVGSRLKRLFRVTFFTPPPSPIRCQDQFPLTLGVSALTQQVCLSAPVVLVFTTIFFKLTRPTPPDFFSHSQ